METTLIITANVIFLTWLYVQQKRLAAFERYCMDAQYYLDLRAEAAESFRAFGEEINDVLKNQSE